MLERLGNYKEVIENDFNATVLYGEPTDLTIAKLLRSKRPPAIARGTLLFLMKQGTKLLPEQLKQTWKKSLVKSLPVKESSQLRNYQIKVLGSGFFNRAVLLE